MRSLTCIVCPIGCSLDVEENSSEPGNLSVTGNRCPRGADYAREEIRAPKRVVTATCRIEGEAGSVRRVPVKTSSPCPRERIPALLDDIYKTTVSLPVKAGDVLIAGWKGEGIDVVATRTFYLSGERVS
jgi:CxxC motif-containing protein